MGRATDPGENHDPGKGQFYTQLDPGAPIRERPRVVAAFATSEIVVFGGAIFLMRRGTLGLGVAVDMARALGSAGLILLLFWWFPPLPFLVGVPVCVIAFLLCSVGLGLIRRADVELFPALIRKERSAAPL